MRYSRPETPEQAAVAIREAARAGHSVRAQGADTWSPGSAEVVISTAGFDRITAFSPRDLTVTAGAGVRLSALASCLADAGVWASWDPPGADRSIGSVVATGTDGPLSLGFGGIKDQLLGLTLVTGGGRVVTAGGKVMKNVAGFDLTRLACGSWGGLGVVTSVNLRLRPCPRNDITLTRSVSRDEGLDTLARIAAAGLTPAATELSVTTGGEPPWQLAIRLAGSDSAVEACTRDLQAETGDWRRADVPVMQHRILVGTVTLRIGCTPRRLRDVLELLAAELPGGAVSVFACSVRWTGTADAGQIAQVRNRSRDIDSPLTVERAPADLLADIGIFGELDDAAALVMRRLRDRFDPFGVLAAGVSLVSQ